MIIKTNLKKIIGIFLTLIFLIGCGSDNNSSKNQTTKTAYIASTDAHYQTLGLKKDTVEPWEDGLRTDGKSGSFEWWYSDFLFSDGTSVVVVFYTKLSFDTYGPAQPMVSIKINYPDGKKVEKQYLQAQGTDINASKLFADVHIGKSYLTYKEGNYRLHFEKDGLIFDANMISILPMTRPKTGVFYFGKDEDKYFAWLPAQTSSNVQATIINDGKTNTLLGLGYHDHNWGNKAMYEVMDSWYWGRATIDDYTIIFSEITAHKDFNSSKIPLFILAKGNKFIKLKGSISIQKNDFVTHTSTKKKYAQSLTFTQTDITGKNYSITSKSNKNLLFMDMNLFPFEMGNNPTYIRHLSDVTLTVTENNGTKTEHKGQGIVEQMSFDDTVME